MAALSLWAGNGIFVPWWVGSQNYGGIWLDLALAMNLIVHAWVLPNRAILSAGLIVRPQTISRIIEGGLNFGLAVLLGIHFGLLGIVISTAIAGIITSCWYLPLLTARLFKQKYLKFLYEDGVYLLIVAILLMTICYYIRFVAAYYHSMIAIILSMSIAFIVGIILLIIIAFDRATRHYLYNKIIYFRI